MTMRDNAELVKNEIMEGAVGGDGVNEASDYRIDCQSCVSARAIV